MDTQQTLTTEQVAILDIIDCLEKFEDGDLAGTDLDEKLDAFSWESAKLDSECIEENMELLEHFGYICADKTLTYEGKQYLMLSKEYTKRKERRSSFISIDKFAILDIDKLGVIFELTNDLQMGLNVIKSNAGKLVISIRDKISKKCK